MESDKSNDRNQNQNQEIIQNHLQDPPSTDTLLLLHNHSDTMGIVQNMNPDGTINKTEPKGQPSDQILKINQEEDSFNPILFRLLPPTEKPRRIHLFQSQRIGAHQNGIMDHDNVLVSVKIFQIFVITSLMDERFYFLLIDKRK